MAVAISGAVLAGGKGVRLGADKATLPFDGGTLLARAAGRLSRVVDEVIVVGREAGQQLASVRFALDIYPGTGALGGVYTAVRAATAPRCLVVACDMPFLNHRLLAYLLDLAPGYDVVMPRLDDYFEPLHAVYAKTCLRPIEDLLAGGNLRILDFFDRVRVRYVERSEIRAFDPNLRSFFNINTPEQLVEAQAMLRTSEGGTR